MTDDREPSEAAREAASKVWYERITTQPTVHGMIEELALALDDFAATSRGSVDGARWRHRVRGSTYIERDRGSLQASRPELLAEGVEMVSYRAADGTTYYRAAPEFDDGRFERLPDEAKSREPVRELDAKTLAVLAAHDAQQRGWDRALPEYLEAAFQAGVQFRGSVGEDATDLARAERLWTDLQENEFGGYSGINRPFWIKVAFAEVRASERAALAAMPTSPEREEIDWLRRLLMWCRPRLKMSAYMDALDTRLEAGPAPAPSGEPPIVQSSPPEREALRIAQVFIEGLAFLTPVQYERRREILARIRAEFGETDE